MSKNLHVIGGSLLGALALMAVSVMPASAATSGETDSTFVITAGTLDVVVAAEADPLTVAGDELSASGSLGAVTVTNGRGDAADWAASVSSTTFTTTGPSGTTVADNVAYTTGEATPGGDGTVALAETNVADLFASTPVVNATGVLGKHTATWTPNVTVSLPEAHLSGTYAGTITTSVA